jgi:hypothetical protein
MRSRGFQNCPSYGPEALHAMGAAFDAAWAELEGNFGDDQPTVALARLKLAKALLSVAHEDSRDVQVLKRAALQAMAVEYVCGLRHQQSSHGA